MAFVLRTNAPAPGRHSFSCTAMWAMEFHRGGGRSRRSRMSTPWWPGTRRAPGARLIRWSHSESRATPIASRASFRNWVWIARMSQGCRSVARSHLHSRDATAQSRRRWFSHLGMRDGRVPCLRTWPNNASAKLWSSPSWRPTTSPERSFRACSRHRHHRRLSRSSAHHCGSFIPPASARSRMHAPKMCGPRSPGLDSTLLVCGDNDVRAPLAVADDLCAAIASSTLVVLRGAGHCCNIEAADDFNREVRSFLRAHR